ncbi:hypothetical protein Q765_05080 [Flavobacterium rivuli WB 3.3-2 = DSM 21788]|uniref:Glycosyl-4,4'-diaponeurosporenoate acyltransferase n=1 Tax=Flavobacterium rivuli WB 3.3-2 = DSM 21788 TaxID=1121895 RepID=A0A0A2M6E6_9FLAO|nr:hypothetical protein [Flavobacterium rivuli]KGO87859.1 hypothetical protein Q765_05080 [Flavobacterium rivuli WB 3.3-2 = DSM 21788]
MLKTYIFAISFTFSLSIIGLLVNHAIKSRPFYSKISNLNFIKSEAANRYLGVVLFKKVLVISFWKHLNPTLKIAGRPDKAKLNALRNEMTTAEVGHLVALMCTFIAVIVMHQKHYYEDAIIPVLVCNIVFHVYPPLVQQYNKRRLDKIIDRISR